jgi:alkyl sulfatase BDS1-like metallo-beta-lactamase superfamily hydrolase
MAIRLDGPRTAGDGVDVTIDWHLTDDDRWIRVTVRHGVLVHQPADGPTDGADARYELARAELLPLVAGFTSKDPAAGSPDALALVQAHLDRFDPAFSIVEP